MLLSVWDRFWLLMLLGVGRRKKDWQGVWSGIRGRALIVGWGGLGSVAASAHTIPSSSTHPIHFLIHPHAEQMPDTQPTSKGHTPAGQKRTEVDRNGQGEECGWGWSRGMECLVSGIGYWEFEIWGVGMDSSLPPPSQSFSPSKSRSYIHLQSFSPHPNQNPPHSTISPRSAILPSTIPTLVQSSSRSSQKHTDSNCSKEPPTTSCTPQRK